MINNLSISRDIEKNIGFLSIERLSGLATEPIKTIFKMRGFIDSTLAHKKNIVSKEDMVECRGMSTYPKPEIRPLSTLRLNKAGKHFHSKDKEIQRDKVSLSKPPLSVKVVDWSFIKHERHANSRNTSNNPMNPVG